MIKYNWQTWFGAIFLLFFSAACAPKVEMRGHQLTPSKLSSLKLGVSTMQDVIQNLGTPSLVATFDSNIWYYIGTLKEGYAFFDKDIIEHQVVELSFDDKRVLSSLKKYDEKDLKTIEYAETETPTAGREFTLWEQIFGNFGARPIDRSD